MADKCTGIIRRIDDLGRIVIPKEIRRNLHITDGDPLEYFVTEDGGIKLKKYSVANAYRTETQAMLQSLAQLCHFYEMDVSFSMLNSDGFPMNSGKHIDATIRDAAVAMRTSSEKYKVCEGDPATTLFRIANSQANETFAFLMAVHELGDVSNVIKLGTFAATFLSNLMDDSML